MHRLINALLVLAAGLILGAATMLVLNPRAADPATATTTPAPVTSPAATADTVPGACLAALVEADNALDATGTLIEQLSRSAAVDVLDAQVVEVRQAVGPYTEARDTCRGLR